MTEFINTHYSITRNALWI